MIGYQSIDITTEKRKLKESEKHSDRHASKVQLKVPTPIGVACADGIISFDLLFPKYCQILLKSPYDFNNQATVYIVMQLKLCQL